MELAIIRETIALVRDDTLVWHSGKTYSAIFAFDASWDGYTKTAHFQAGSVAASAVLTDGKCDIPAQCLENAGVMLKVFVEGVKDGETKRTCWGLTSKILYNTVIDIPTPPSPSPTPTGEVGRLSSDFADMLSKEYSEEDLKNKTLAEIMEEMEEDYVPTATDSEVDDILDDVWGPD